MMKLLVIVGVIYVVWHVILFVCAMCWHDTEGEAEKARFEQMGWTLGYERHGNVLSATAKDGDAAENWYLIDRNGKVLAGPFEHVSHESAGFWACGRSSWEITAYFDNNGERISEDRAMALMEPPPKKSEPEEPEKPGFGEKVVSAIFLHELMTNDWSDDDD